jgi:hypothetical protein
MFFRLCEGLRGRLIDRSFEAAARQEAPRHQAKKDCWRKASTDVGAGAGHAAADSASPSFAVTPDPGATTPTWGATMPRWLTPSSVIATSVNKHEAVHVE